MKDLTLFKRVLEDRINKLEYAIINTGSGCEMGMSSDFVKRLFKTTREEIGLK